MLSKTKTLQTPVVNDKGEVVGTEDRVFFIIEKGRNLIVKEEAPEPTKEDREDCSKFLAEIKKDPFLGALLIASKDENQMARFRRAFRESCKEELLEFVKATFKQNAALGNFVASICYPMPEFFADEVHLATMGLSDNHGAIVDAICSSNKQQLKNVKLFYGIKFGDGRYEVKSEDGLGDKEKLERDVRASSKGRIQQLLLERIKGIERESSPTSGKEFVDGESKDIEKFIQFLATASAGQLTEFQNLCGSVENQKKLANTFAGDDKELARAFFCVMAPRQNFWLERLQQSVLPKLNKKLLLRVVSVNSPSERRALAELFNNQQKSDLMSVLAGKENDMKFLRILFGGKN